MKCKVHRMDHTSSIGVCASCLHDRLSAVIAAQAQADARAQKRHLRRSNANQPQLLFPRSVSPYISRRKSDTSPQWHHVSNYHNFPHQKFFSTPQIGHVASIVDDHQVKKKNKFSLLSNLFKFRTGKRVTGSDLPGPEPEEMSTKESASPLWFSSIHITRKQSKISSTDQSQIKSMRRSNRTPDCGVSQMDGNLDHLEEWKQTPRTSGTTGKHSGGKTTNLSRNVSGIGFWLNPLVGARPNRHRNVPPEVVSEKLHHSIHSPFCKNRSTKLADFGRYDRNH